jgi:hypothetical protein
MNWLLKKKKNSFQQNKTKNILGRIMNITVNYLDKSKQKKIENIPEKMLYDGKDIEHKTSYTHNNTNNLDLYFFFLGPICISSGSTSAFKAYCATLNF